jgi:hypothetical protein
MNKENMIKAMCDYLDNNLYEGIDDFGDKVVICDMARTKEEFINRFKEHMEGGII